MLVDTVRLRYWMNARKVTAEEVADAVGMSVLELDSLLGRDDTELTDATVIDLSKALDVEPSQLSAAASRGLSCVIMTAEESHSTRRSIHRDGIPFYNYYTLAAPRGRVAPVILDILCPPDRLPALNNGHLEPSITVNLGPGDVHGRWGTELTSATWQVLRASRAADDWIVGDSYVEPSYCPHSYSLVSDMPARIISYTCHPPLASLVSSLNDWPQTAFASFVDQLGGASVPALLGLLLDRRCLDPDAADRAAGLPVGVVRDVLAGDRQLGLREAQALGESLGFDYRLLLEPVRDHDEVGKTYCPLERSRASIRRFRGYQVASMAGAAGLSDLVGMFMAVSRPAQESLVDLCDLGETHYLVRSGSLHLSWRARDGHLRGAKLGPGDSAWLGPFVEHGWTGEGALIRLGSGRHVSYLDLFQLSHTFAVRQTLKRAYRDRLGWGYDASDQGAS